MAFNESEYNALLNLLDDNDSEVVHHVFQRIEQIGEIGVPILQKHLNTGSDLLQEKISKLLENFQQSRIYNELLEWYDQEGHGLFKAVYLVSKVFDLNLKEIILTQQIESISKRIWLRIYQNQSPFEQVQVINYVLFSKIQFDNKGIDKRDFNLNLIDQVMNSRKGNSLGIGLLYLLIAENLELPIYGISLPHYFALTFTRVWHSQKSFENLDTINDMIFYINLIEKGQTFSKLEIDQYLSHNNFEPEKSYYQPSSNKVIIQLLIHQLLGNLDPIENSREYEQLENMARIFDKK